MSNSNSAGENKNLREKYKAEREKRLRSDGAAQYIRVENASGFLEDPFSAFIERAPVRRKVKVAIIGGGFAGLIAGALLRKKGNADLLILDDASDFGGTWYWNRYPGARCDIEAYIYLPMLEEVGYMPSERYARSNEIFEHARRLGRHFDLYKDALFQTRLEKASWDESRETWLIETSRGDAIEAQFLVLGSGQMLSRPKLPGIPGIETFEGHSFHTSRWDFGYTGGDTTGGLHKLKDKSVAIIGTGATAVQAVPYLAENCKQLYVFQRTPSMIDIRANAPTDREWVASLAPDWQIERMLNFDQAIEGRNAGVELVRDQWTQIWGRPVTDGMTDGERAQAVEDYDDQQIYRLHKRVEDAVADPNVAESLKPYYNRFCKRPCFNDEYLDTFNLPHVTLVHTDGKGPDEISAHAVHFGGRAFDVDCIIYATGFESFNTTPSQSGRYEVIGKNSLSLDQKWGGDTNKYRSLHGIMANGFPNMFVLGSSRQSATSFNIPHRLRRQADHVIELIARCMADGIQSIEPTREAEESWLDTVNSVHTRGDIDAKMRECTPGYYNNEGMLNNQKSVIAAGFGGGTADFCARLEAWRKANFNTDLRIQKRDVCTEQK